MKTLPPFVRRLTDLPGPIWLFCGLCVNLLFMEIRNMGVTLLGGRYFADGLTGVLFWWADPSFRSVCWGVLLWGFVARKHFAVPLAGWYAGFELLMRFGSLLGMFLNAEYWFENKHCGEFFSECFTNLYWCVLWFLFMRYLERSETLGPSVPPFGATGALGGRACVVLVADRSLVVAVHRRIQLMNEASEIGRRGEEAAVEYLRREGFSDLRPQLAQRTLRNRRGGLPGRVYSFRRGQDPSGRIAHRARGGRDRCKGRRPATCSGPLSGSLRPRPRAALRPGGR